MAVNSLARIVLGVTLSVGTLYFLFQNDLQGWLLPYLLLMGLIPAIVAGWSWGWAISAAVLMVWAAIDLILKYAIGTVADPAMGPPSALHNDKTTTNPSYLNMDQKYLKLVRLCERR